MYILINIKNIVTPQSESQPLAEVIGNRDISSNLGTKYLI
jgi:hypothetical protein